MHILKNHFGFYLPTGDLALGRFLGLRGIWVVSLKDYCWVWSLLTVAPKSTFFFSWDLDLDFVLIFWGDSMWIIFCLFWDYLFEEFCFDELFWDSYLGLSYLPLCSSPLELNEPALDPEILRFLLRDLSRSEILLKHF